MNLTHSIVVAGGEFRAATMVDECAGCLAPARDGSSVAAQLACFDDGCGP